MTWWFYEQNSIFPQFFSENRKIALKNVDAYKFKIKKTYKSDDSFSR